MRPRGRSEQQTWLEPNVKIPRRCRRGILQWGAKKDQPFLAGAAAGLAAAGAAAGAAGAAAVVSAGL